MTEKTLAEFKQKALEDLNAFVKHIEGLEEMWPEPTQEYSEWFEYFSNYILCREAIKRSFDMEEE